MGRIIMKKFITTFLMAIMMAVTIPAMTSASAAPSRCYNSKTKKYYACKRPNVYRRHRKAFNIGIGTGVGMLVGGLLGGGKGVVIGGLGGAAGGALFTHKQQPKNYVRRTP